jgi:hypothetical protein
MDKIITQKLYNGEITITFNGGTEEAPKHLYHVLDENGKQKRLCGVTTYLGTINKPALINWAVGITIEYIREHIDELQTEPRQLLENAKKEAERLKKEAADIGKAVHAWIEAYIKSQIAGEPSPEMPEKEEVLNGVNNFMAWIEKDRPEFHASEMIIYSKKYGYVGQVDVVATIGDKKYLTDVKTTNGIWPEMLAQTAAYQKGYEEQTNEKLDGRIILKIDKDAEKPVEPIFLDEEENTVDRDFKCFLAAMEIYEWQKEANKHLKNLRG